MKFTRVKSELLKQFKYVKGTSRENQTNYFDVHLIGHYLNGFHLVKNENGNIGTVFLQF